jgi:heme A synthase
MPESGSANRPFPSVAREAWLIYAFTVAVILWGAYVRAPELETIIEFTHRLTSGLAFLLVCWLTFRVFRSTGRGHPARPAALSALFFMVTEALVGAGLVLFGLVGENTSLTRAWVMAFHLVNTFLLLAALALTAWWLNRPASRRTDSWIRPAVTGTVVLGTLLLVGMSGAVAALGDTLFPAVSLAEGVARDFHPESHILIRLRIYHPALALASVLVVLVGLQRLGPARAPAARKWVRLTVVLLVTQIAVGLINLWLLAPVVLQMIHLLAADLLWTAAVLAVAEQLWVAEPQTR